MHYSEEKKGQAKIQTKNRPSKKLHKRDKEDKYICYKLLLRAINNDFLKSDCKVIYDKNISIIAH